MKIVNNVNIRFGGAKNGFLTLAKPNRATTVEMTNQITEGEQQLIELLRNSQMTISELVEGLGVSANAVRQRLVRLTATGLISRQKSGDGPGRPSFTYELTQSGHRTAGDNFADLARVLWQEIQCIEDPQVRQSVMAGAVRRLFSRYEEQVTGETVEDRLSSVGKFFADRDIPITIETDSGLPILKVLECPYPDLEDKDHQFCEIEKKLFAKVLGSPVQLCQCRKDGDGCCTFQSVEQSD